jgi:hypothetical protein
MLAKEIGILMVLCFGFSNTPLEFTKQEKPTKVSSPSDPDLSKLRRDDITNHRNTVYVKELKYTHDAKFNKFANITIKNTTKHIILAVSFNLKDSADKGGRNCYEVKRKIKLQPNQSLNILQRLNMGDREAHTIENLKVKYAIEVNFTLD